MRKSSEFCNLQLVTDMREKMKMKEVRKMRK